MAINSVNYYAAAAKAMSNTSNSVNRSENQYGSWYTKLYGNATQKDAQMLSTMYNTATSVAAGQTTPTTTTTPALSSADAALQKLYATVNGVSTGSPTSADQMLSNLSQTVNSAGGGSAYSIAKSLNKSITDQTAALADSAGFVKTYSDNLKSLKAAGNALSTASMSKMLGTPKDGAFAQEGIDKATAAVQSMVEQYNSTLSNLKNNTDRGSGVGRQISAMTQTPTSAKSMAKIGLGYDDKGNMVFNKDTFTSTMQKAAKSDAVTGSTAQTGLTLDIVNSVGRGVERSSSVGLMRQSNSLINNDLKTMNDQRVSSVIGAWSNIYNQNGIAALAGAGSFFSARA